MVYEAELLELRTFIDKVKADGKISRTEIQKMVNKLRGKQLSLKAKKDILRLAIGQTGVREIGMATAYTPRAELKEVDKTYDFLDDLQSYKDWDK